MDYVQAIIARLANNSFIMKGWALTLTSALLGFAATRSDALLAFLALAAVLAFWFLDAYFLRQERAFRLMFSDVAAKKVTGFNLNPATYAKRVKWWPTLRSVSLGVFYGALLTLSLSLAIILLTAIIPTVPGNSVEPSPSVSATP
ncbi:MAG: hypothetical protein QM622_01050 [Microbacterium sp.]